GLGRAPVPHRQELVPAQAAALSRPGQEHRATAYPVRPGQPGDRQENPARAGPCLNHARTLPCSKTTLENPSTKPVFYPHGPLSAAPASKIMPQPPIPPAALVLFGVSLGGRA